MAFHAVRPDYVLLFCLRNRHTETLVVSTERVLSGLSSSTKSVLSQDFFQIDPPRSYQKAYPSTWRPVLLDDSLVLAQHCRTRFLHPTAEEASYQDMMRVAEGHIGSICLQPGDLRVLDNRKVLHGRQEIVNDSTRWLKRIYVRASDYRRV